MVSFCYGDIMSKEFNKLINAHEVDDKDYVHDVDAVRERIKEEFENADEFLSYLEKDEKAAKAFFDYSGSKPYLFSVIPVRKSDRLYVKKHTATQRPYYHSHAFYEIICRTESADFFITRAGSVMRSTEGARVLSHRVRCMLWQEREKET